MADKYKDGTDERSYMKKIWMIVGIAVLIFLLWTVTAFATEPQSPFAGSKIDKKETSAADVSEVGKITLKIPFSSPLFSNFPLAIVNDEAITLRDLNTSLTSTHGEMADVKKTVAKADFFNILERLISVRLIVQEARNMGLADLPEIKNTVHTFSKSSIRDLLIEEVGKDAKADEGAVEKLYKEVIKEWKIKSVMFRQEDEAKKMEEEIKTGKSFDEMVTKVLDEKLAEGTKEGGYVKPQALQPEIAGIISNMEVGTVSSIIRIGLGKNDTGYVFLKLVDVRYPDDPEAKERAKEVILSGKKTEAVKDFKRDLIKKFTKINFQRIRKLDFESEKTGIEKLMNDKRVIVEIKGEKPLTVGDLTRALHEKYYHGLETAIKSKNVNSKKLEMLDQMLEKLLFRKEALKRGIDKTEKYKNMVREYEDSLLFELFVQKVLAPDVKVSEEEMKTYYADHKQEFTYPEMIKLDSLVFGKLNDAESALAKLKQGADFKWMKENAEGQVPKGTTGVLSFEADVLITKELTEGLQKALAGVRSEDFRLYESPEGHFYVLYIRDVVPSSIQAIEEVQGIISNNLLMKKLDQSMKEWADKLRESADIKNYLAVPDNENDNEEAN